jgi:D-threo-aldose 1-dehydrogenase
MALDATSLFASRFGLGTHALHRLIPGAARRSLLALAYDLGLRYFDTAPCYGPTVAERELGRFARARRSELVLATKFGIPAGYLASRVPGWMYAAMAARGLARLVGTRRLARAPVRDYGAAGARASVEQSLRALATDHIDILYLHQPALRLLSDVEALIRTLEELKAGGKVRYIGLSGNAAECAQIARAHPALAQVLQIEVSRDQEGLPVAEVCERRPDVSFWEFAPGGRGTASPERLAQLVSRLRAAAPQGLLMLSTNTATELRRIVAGIEKIDPGPVDSATATLAWRA